MSRAKHSEVLPDFRGLVPNLLGCLSYVGGTAELLKHRTLAGHLRQLADPLSAVGGDQVAITEELAKLSSQDETTIDEVRDWFIRMLKHQLAIMGE